MRRTFITALFCLMTTGFVIAQNTEPFGWATSSTLNDGDSYHLTGGYPTNAVGELSQLIDPSAQNKKTIVLHSNGTDMRDIIFEAIKDYDIIVFDGSQGDFELSGIIRLEQLRSRTLLGVNHARLRTSFEVNETIRALLDKEGVLKLSDQGGGGTLSNGARVAEAKEQRTRQLIIDHSGDSTEHYRESGIFSLRDCENFIIRNIAFQGPGSIDVGGSDLLSLYNSRHIWVDHCSFTDGMDGNLDISTRSDFITVSWTTFQYSELSYDHAASNLIASSEHPSQGEDNFNVTYAYCVWGKGCDVRMPMARFGKVHLLNNWYNCAGNGSVAINARKGSELLIEGCYFDKDVKKIFAGTEDAIAWQLRDNIFRERFNPSDRGVVSVPYKYSVLSASRVPTLLRKEAGPTLELTVPQSTVKFTIHMIGDSTMADKDISKGSPERGWGMVFENFVDDGVRVINYARNGRSSKSIIDEGLWDKVKANLQRGDYLFIQFGHNDQKENSPKVYAPVWTAYQDNLRMFINTAREKGATPVLFTSVARRHFRPDGTMDTGTLGEYPASMKTVAQQTGTPIIDMEAATIEWISKAGDLASRDYFMWVGTLQDNTHSNPRGARRNCEIASDSLAAKIPEIAQHLVHYDIVVDKEGRGDYMSIQEAIDAVPDYLSSHTTTILIKPGIYRERLIIPASKSHLHIKGCGSAQTIITYDNYASKLWPYTQHAIGTSGSASVFVDANYVTFEDLSIRNDAGPVGQAVALLTNGDALFFRRCHIFGHQDTLYTLGKKGADGQSKRSYYLDCLIEGTTDFIFGSGINYFDNCEIRSKKDSYITAASTLEGEEYGYVFRRCHLTSAPAARRVYLGRPWRDYARVVWIECYMDSHIRPEGWHNWSQPAREKTAYYAEYGSKGPGASTTDSLDSGQGARVSWSHQLSAEQAALYTPERVLRLGEDGWL